MISHTSAGGDAPETREAEAPPDPRDVNSELALRLRQQELAAEFANFSLQTDELQPILDAACSIAARGLDCRYAKILEHQEDERDFLVRAGIGWHEGVVGHARLGGGLDSPAGFAFQTGEPVLSNGLQEEHRFRTPALLREHGIDCAFNVLIHTPTWRYGVLEVDNRGQREFSRHDIPFLTSLAALLAGAIGRQKRFEAMSRSTAFIQSVLDASPDCIAVFDAGGRLVQMNPAGLSLLGHGFDEIAGRRWDEWWSGAEREHAGAAVAHAREGRVGRFEAATPTADGSPKTWDVQVTAIDPQEGGAQRLLSIWRDVTARAADAQTKDLLMLEVHHRVKNSLQLVHNLLSLQGRASNDEAASSQLMESAARVRTIAAIHDRLYKSGSALTVGVAAYLEGLVDDLRDGIASTLDGRAIVVEADDVEWPARDMTTLGLVLTELATNALKYGAGTITVTFRQPPDGNPVLTVQDEGEALPPGFDPLEAGGLGMRLVHGLLRGQGAGLRIERVADATRFVATLPKLKPPEG